MPRIIRNNNDEVEEVGANASREGGGEEKQSMKKGPWTAAEDAILIEYVKKYGEGNWNSVQRNSGLSRCGKSCRLRWANHLRPNLKKGAFSQEEEQIIIELHAKLGNKWARMASQLPGRTDNEIKNFWNTRMKRRQRAGLPLYPPEVQDEAALYHLHQHQQYFAPPHPSSFSFSSLLSSSNYRQKLNELNYSSAANQSDSAYDQQFKFSNKNNGNLGLPLSSFSPYGSSSSTLLNHSFATHSAAAADSHDYQSGTYKYDFNSSAVVPGLNTTEISSSQSPPGSETPASSYTSGVHGLMGASSIAMDYYEVAPLSPEGNSGLLDALVMEAQALSRSDNKSKSEDSTAAGKLSLKRKRMAVEESTEEEDPVPVELAMKNGGDTTAETQRDDLSSSQLSTGKKPIADKDPFMEEMNSMDDDLFSLLNNFPSEMPMPEWYRKGERQSLEIENRQDASPGPTDQELAWTLGTCWNNMPRIC